MFTDFDLSDLRRRYPLPDGVADDVVNRDDLAYALDVTTPTIDNWRKGGMPCLAEGTNGRGYQFQLADCWAWREGYRAARDAETARKRKNLDQMRLALHGDERLDDIQYLTPKEQQLEYQAAEAFMATAHRQGQLVWADEMRDLMERLFAICREHGMQLPDILERRLALTPDQVVTAVDVGRDFIVALRREIDARFSDPARAAAE